MKLFNLFVSSVAVTSSLCHAAKDSGLRRRTQYEFLYEDTTDATTTTTMMGNEVMIRITNQAYQQPFGAFFVMTHNANETSLFTSGMEASEALARLAEDGNPAPLVEAYNMSANVGYLGVQSEGAPYFGGDTVEFMVPYDEDYPYLTLTSMAINTNDCFVALNGVKLTPGMVMSSPGYDSGTEENNESCDSIPGPACADVPGNEESGNGEGFVHVHRGFFGVGSLAQSGYDWRNPMMRVEMM